MTVITPLKFREEACLRNHSVFQLICEKYDETFRKLDEIRKVKEFCLLIYDFELQKVKYHGHAPSEASSSLSRSIRNLEAKVDAFLSKEGITA